MPGLIRLLLLLGIGYLVFAGIRRLFSYSTAASNKNAGQSHTTEPDSEPLVQDPQCGRFIPQREAIVVPQRGHVLYFCSQECHAAYREI